MSDHSIPPQDKLGGSTELDSQQVSQEPTPYPAGINDGTMPQDTTKVDETAEAGATESMEPATGAANPTPLKITVPGSTTDNGAPSQTTVPGLTTDNIAPPVVMTLEDLATADPDAIVHPDVVAKLFKSSPLPIPAANPFARENQEKNSSSSSGPSNSTKRSATTETSGTSSNYTKRQRLVHYRGAGPPPYHSEDLTGAFPPFADPVVSKTPFAPPYQSVFLRQNPELTHALAHVNCSYLTTHDSPDFKDHDSRANTAPTLAELKAHARSLLLVIRSMSISSRAALTDNATLRNSAPESENPTALAPDFYSSLDAFDFLNDLNSPYRSRDPVENEPLTNLLNQLVTRPDPSRNVSATSEVCPLATVKVLTKGSAPVIFRPGVNPLPHSQINRLMAHADELLLQIDAALSSSGGLLAALPLDLPPSDPRRRTYIGQLIHFMRTLVGRLHVLDRDYGQALGLLAGEATIPAELKLNIERPEQIEAPLVAAQHRFIINTATNTYARIWERLRESANDKAVRKTGMGILDVVISTRYRALRGGKTIYVTPVPDDPQPSEVVGRPTVVACPQPGFGTRTSEWERKKGAALREAEGLRVRAEMAEKEVERLKKDVEALVPEGVWANGEKENVLTMWGKVQAEKDAMAGERKQLEMFKSRCKVLEEKNSEFGMELVKEKEKMKKRRDIVVETLREETRKLLNELRTRSMEVDGLKKHVVDLQTQLVEAKRKGGGNGDEIQA